MALTERRWRRRQPTIREVASYVYGAYVYDYPDYYYYALEGGLLEIETTAFVRGTVSIVSHPSFLERDGTFLRGNFPLMRDDDGADIFEIDLEARV